MKKALLAGLVVGLMLFGAAGMTFASSHYEGHEHDDDNDSDGGHRETGYYHHDDEDSGRDEEGECTTGNPCTPGGSVHTWYDTANFTSGTNNYLRFDSNGDKATVTFDISPPFTVGTDEVKEVQFFLEVLVPGDSGEAAAKVLAGTWTKTIDDLTSDNGWDWSSSVTNDADILGHLNGSGELSFTIAWKTGDFRVKSAGIAATGCDYPDPAPVPEPATMLLLGTGLAGLAGARRKKKA